MMKQATRKELFLESHQCSGKDCYVEFGVKKCVYASDNNGCTHKNHPNQHVVRNVGVASQIIENPGEDKLRIDFPLVGEVMLYRERTGTQSSWWFVKDNGLDAIYANSDQECIQNIKNQFSAEELLRQEERLDEIVDSFFQK